MRFSGSASAPVASARFAEMLLTARPMRHFDCQPAW